MLGPRHGGLTSADLAALEVHDDQVKLQMSFGGFWSALHLIAVSIFLVPYVAFGVRRYLEQQLSPCAPADCVPLRRALGSYVLTGGRGGEVDWVALAIFGMLLLYNILRVSLVLKSRALTLAESALGMPRQFVLAGYWLAAYHSSKGLAWLNVALVLMHAWQMLSAPVHR